jgi:phosphatidylglycerophosphatase A
VFLFLVLMIGTTIVAFQKKSLFHFYLFDMKKSDYISWYQREVEAEDPK